VLSNTSDSVLTCVCV